MCTINDNYMMYSSWDVARNRQNLLSFWAIFCTFTPVTTQKIKILKKWKKHLEILSLYTCVPKMTIIWCMDLEIWSVTDKVFCHFRPFFALLAISKRKTGDIIILHMCTINENHMMYGSWDIWSATDRILCHFCFLPH